MSAVGEEVAQLHITTGIPKALFPLSDKAIEYWANQTKEAATLWLTEHREGPP